jgi:pimeloyl-ACP methyl ester carboxylesterase
MANTATEPAFTWCAPRGAGRQIWLAGISLGAFNALHYAAAHASHLAGLQLIAPYPGTGDVLAEINAAGGPGAWAQSAASVHNDERSWWRWLCQQAGAQTWPTPVYFGTGETDRFLRGQRMMADLLPAAQVRYVPGGHDWPTWTALWQVCLNEGPLSRLALNARIPT